MSSNAELMISVSGLRGIVGQSLTPEVAAAYVAALAETLGPGPVVVSRDGRTSGPALAEVVVQTLAGAGRNVLYADVAATPTLGVLVRSLAAAGGVQISASHNPPEYNGLKLFGPEGRVLSAAAGSRVLEAYRRVRGPRSEVGDWKWVDRRREGEALAEPRGGTGGGAVCTTIADTTSEHLRLVLATVDAAAVQARGFRVLLDSNGGAGGILGRRLLESLGCEVTMLGGEANGVFSHPPEPTRENLRDVCERVRAANVDVGFCQDPDADRLAVIDETGRYIGEEYTLALCLDHVLRQRHGPIVTNCATSRMAEDLAARYNVPLYRSAVGEANVVEKMLEVGAVFGGEGNGGPIDPRVGLVRDSFVGMALILAAMAARGQSVSQLAGELPRYEIVKRTIKLPPGSVGCGAVAGGSGSNDIRLAAFAPLDLSAALANLERRFADARADRLDGLRLDWPDRWLIIRGSNTEPIVRIIAEAPTAALAEELVAAAVGTVAGASEANWTCS